jgi:hypothetical protein
MEPLGIAGPEPALPVYGTVTGAGMRYDPG